MKNFNTKRIVVGSDKGLTDLQENINSLQSKGILKGYEEEGGIRGAAMPFAVAPLGRVYWQNYQRMSVFKRIRKWILNQS